MIKNIMFLLTLLLLFAQCVPKRSNGTKQASKNGSQIKNSPKQILKAKTGLKIETGPNQGIRANASLGIKNPFIYTTSTITNDSTIPIHLKIALSEELEFPSFCNDDKYKYKVVLLPKELTPDTATIRNEIISGSDDFLKNPLDNPYVLNKTLNPGEFCVITIGTQYPSFSNCEVVPRTVFSQDNKGLYHACERQLNQSISIDPQFEIGIKLEHYYRRKFIAPEDVCTVIPCGQISYPEH